MKQPVNASWFVLPPVDTPRFLGLHTNVDPSQVPLTAHVGGYNTFVNDQDRISTRPWGLTLFPEGTASVASGGIKSMYTFRLRNGENILVRASGTVLEWYDETSTTYANLLTGLASDDFGFAEFNINANAESRLYFGNGVDNSGYWNGGHTNLTGALVGGEATINVTSTASFSATGTIRIGTTNVTYSGVTATSFTGCAGTPAASNGAPVAQAVTQSGSIPKGNIIMTAQNRLFIVPEVNPQIIQFSKYGDSTSWTTNTVTSATADAAGAFNLIEGGGRINAMVQDESNLYFLKDSCIYVATLSDALYSLQMLKPFDGRSRATGAIGKRGVFVGGNFVFIVTPDNQIFSLQRVQDVNYPQLRAISESIQPTCDGFDFSETVGIAFKEYAYFACKSSADVATNDTVLAFNLNHGHWESPITGWQVGEWAIYNSVGENNLYFGDAVSPNTWKLSSSVITDGEYIISSLYTGRQFDFGLPTQQKRAHDLYIEGYITPTTNLTIKLLLDEGGFSGVQQTIFSGSENQFITQGQTVNAFGLLPFGTAVFGSNPDLSGKRKFRIHLSKDFFARCNPFYNCQLQFSSSGQNQQWEIIRYAMLAEVNTQPTRQSLIRAFN